MVFTIVKNDAPPEAIHLGAGRLRLCSPRSAFQDSVCFSNIQGQGDHFGNDFRRGGRHHSDRFDLRYLQCLDRTLYWTTADLESKLRILMSTGRMRGFEGRLPDSGEPRSPISFASYRWQKHCRGLY